MSSSLYLLTSCLSSLSTFWIMTGTIRGVIKIIFLCNFTFFAVYFRFCIYVLTVLSVSLFTRLTVLKETMFSGMYPHRVMIPNWRPKYVARTNSYKLFFSSFFFFADRILLLLILIQFCTKSER